MSSVSSVGLLAGEKTNIERVRLLCASCKNVLILYRALSLDSLGPFRLRELYNISKDIEPSYPSFKARVARMMEAGLVERVAYGHYVLNLSDDEQQLVEIMARICAGKGGDEA